MKEKPKKILAIGNVNEEKLIPYINNGYEVVKKNMNDINNGINFDYVWIDESGEINDKQKN